MVGRSNGRWYGSCLQPAHSTVFSTTVKVIPYGRHCYQHSYHNGTPWLDSPGLRRVAEPQRGSALRCQLSCYIDAQVAAKVFVRVITFKVGLSGINMALVSLII